MSVDTFGIEKEFLRGLLEEVKDGRIRLPEFQRGWVWPDRNIASLIASVSLGYPVGTVMMLKTGGDVRFLQRPVEGAEDSATKPAERLILDGQQRLTSLYQALLLERPIETVDVRKKPLSGWFYISIDEALDPHADRENAIRFLPKDKMVRNFRGEIEEDYSTPEKEYETGMFPVHRIFEPEGWEMGYQEYWDYNKEHIKNFHNFRREVLQRFSQYQIPVIELGSATPKDAVCQVFEKVNTGGVTLTVFELLTATFAADEFQLRKDWDERRAQWKGEEFRTLREVTNTDFLQIVTLLATRAAREKFVAAKGEDDRAPRIGCKRSDMLALELSDYQEFAPLAVEGLKAAAKFLHKEFIFDTRFLPYGTQLIPLAAILAVAGKDADVSHDKLARWYWSGVFGELYGGAVETRFSRDLPDVISWLKGGEEPRTVTEAQFASGRLLTLRTRQSAAYKGIYTLLLREGAEDWRTGSANTVQHYFDETVDIHHIFPRAWNEKHDVPASTYNSIINKTPLTARTNRIIGGNAPSEYLATLEKKYDLAPETVDQRLRTHLIDPELLRADDFTEFFDARHRALLAVVGAAMGKHLEMETGTVALEADDDEDEDVD
jgi:hypothetical protein